MSPEHLELCQLNQIPWIVDDVHDAIENISLQSQENPLALNKRKTLTGSSQDSHHDMISLLLPIKKRPRFLEFLRKDPQTSTPAAEDDDATTANNHESQLPAPVKLFGVYIYPSSQFPPQQPSATTHVHQILRENLQTNSSKPRNNHQKDELQVLPAPQISGAAVNHTPWAVTKVLETSDVGDRLHRLALPKEMAEQLLRQWDDADTASLLRDCKVKVDVVVRDMDTGANYNMTISRWANKMYNLQRSWVKNFVQPRNLKKGDKIGLRWDKESSMFLFWVVSRLIEA